MHSLLFFFVIRLSLLSFSLSLAGWAGQLHPLGILPMVMVWKDPTLKHSPPNWKECDQLLSKFTKPNQFGFSGEAQDINHFKSRYRVAKSFQAISLDTFSQSTIDGYSAIFKVFLTWSAFEIFLDIIDIKRNNTSNLISKYNPELIAASIRSVPEQQNFVRFVLERVNKEHQPQIQAFLDGKACDVTYLASGIRHIFAHGTLTPHAGSNSADPSKAICLILIDFLFKIMDYEFSSRVLAFPRSP